MITFLAKLILFVHHQFKKIILLSQLQIAKTKCTIGEKTIIFEEAKINNFFKDKSKIAIGNESRIRGDLSIFSKKGNITIGEYCYVGDLSRIWCAENITIGNRVLISHNVNIHDFNSHPTSSSRRHLQAVGIFERGHTDDLHDVPSFPIVIEDDVWIGFNSTILKGVRIGKGAIVGANTMVTHDIPAYSVVVGNPAVIIKNLEHE